MQDGLSGDTRFDDSRFNEGEFAAAFDSAQSRCTELSDAEAQHFIEKGYVVVKAAFPAEIAAEVCAQAWRELAEHGADEHDRRSWRQQFPGKSNISGYMRTAGSDRRFVLRRDAPRAMRAQMDAIGGGQRLPGHGEKLAWGDNAIANLGGPHWQPPAPRQAQGRLALSPLHQRAG